MIEHVIKRSKQVKGVDTVVLCTSVNSQDRLLTDIALENGIHYYIGSEEDVLLRLSNCSDFFEFDYVLNITGENPLFSIDYANQIVDKLKREKLDFTFVKGLPVGASVYGLRTKALKTVCEVKKEVDTEIWGALINRPDIYNVKLIDAEPFFKREELRLTNDYPEDYRFMCEIFSFFPQGSTPSLYDALSVLDKNPYILEINKDKKQLNLSQETLKRIDTFFEQNRDEILKIKEQIYNE